MRDAARDDGDGSALSLSYVSVLHAAVTQSEPRMIGVKGAEPSAHTTLPLNLPLQRGRRQYEAVAILVGKQGSPLGAVGLHLRDAVLARDINASDALAHSELRPGSDFRLIVVGLHPGFGDANRMKQAQVGLDNNNSSASYFLRGDTEAIDTLTRALGFVSVYDRDRDQFAHPAAAFVIAPDGRLARALPGLAVDPLTIRLAIIDAGNGVVGTWTDHIRLLCYGYDPASGTYSVAIGRLWAASGGVTVAVLALLIGLLDRTRRDGPLLTCEGRRNAYPVRRNVRRSTFDWLWWEVFSGYLGFSHDDASKVMGSAAYGNPEVFRQQFLSILRTDEVNYGVAQEFLGVHPYRFARMEAMFGPPRDTGSEILPRHADMAAALQAATDAAVAALVRRVKRRVPFDNLCLAGGVALNCVTNELVRRSGEFSNVFIPSAPHDAGTAIGAAFAVHCAKQKRPPSEATPRRISVPRQPARNSGGGQVGPSHAPAKQIPGAMPRTCR